MKRQTHKLHFFSKAKRGFTLVEIVLVISILLILTAIFMPNIFRYLNTAKTASDVVELSRINNATELYASSGNKSAADVFAGTTSDSEKLVILVSNGYLPSVPVPVQSGISYHFDSDAGTWTLSSGLFVDSKSAKVLYQSDFTSMDKIGVLSGAWQVVNGKLSPAKSGEDRAILKGTNSSDYNISVTATLATAKAGSSGYGIYYRATENANISGYCFQYDPGAGNRFVVKKVTDGKEASSFQMVSMSKVMGSNFDMSASHEIQINVTGDKHTITVDGVKVMDFSDSTFTQGSVGVRSWSDSQVQISDISVTAPAK